jgi:hypothetical protein
MLDAGNYGDANNWWLGRDDSFFNTRFWIHDANGNKTNGVSFPDGSQGADSGWHHYVVTWSGNVFIGYFDGSPFITNTVANAPFRTVTQPNGWLAVGCYTHGGTPDFTDNESASPDSGFHSYPNNGWLLGGIADSRIYNRALAAGEVSSIYAGTNYSGGSTAPTITVQPASQTNYVGSNVVFSVTATGTAPLGYLWRFNGGAIANTTSAWALTNIQLTDGGPYVCWVTNLSGTATSAVATLTVWTNPVTPPAVGVPIGTLTVSNLTVKP